MKKLVTVLAVAVVVASSLGIATSALAITTYSYTGNNFDNFFSYGGMYVAGEYTGSMRVTGWFEVANPIAAGVSDQFITPLSYSFFDGRITYTDQNSVVWYPGSSFSVSTNETGDISSWYIGVKDPNMAIGEVFTMKNYLSGGQFYTYDQGMVRAGNWYETGSVTNNAGEWTKTTPTPIPGALVLFGSGLLGLVGIGRRRFKK